MHPRASEGKDSAEELREQARSELQAVAGFDARAAKDELMQKVEDEARLLDLLDYEVDFGQGYLFGEPRLARPAA